MIGNDKNNAVAVLKSLQFPRKGVGLEQNKEPGPERKMEEITVTEEKSEGSGISGRRLVIIVVGLCLAVFLTALDQVCILKVFID